MNDNYFKFQELVKTQTGLPNYPTSDSHLGNLACLWDFLNSVRQELGHPIVINSAYRTPAVNKQVGGAKRSLHMQGRAADICCAPLHMEELWTILEKQKDNLSELIKYSTFYHIAL